MALRHRHLLQTLSTSLRMKMLKESGSLKFDTRQFCVTNSCEYPKNLIGAVCLERYPVVTATKTKIEERFSEMLSQIELEKSYYSDHEVRLFREKQNIKNKAEDDDKDNTDAQTGLDLEDKWENELKAFTPASRETEADKKNDMHSVDRKLDSTLYLLVKQSIDGKDHWILPQTSWKDGETMRQTAERALSSVGGNITATFLGNAPCGFAKFDPFKIFFFKAWYKDGDIKPNEDLVKDFLWVTRNELSKYCFPSYKQNINKFIPPP